MHAVVRSMKSLRFAVPLASILCAAPAWADEPLTSESGSARESAEPGPRTPSSQPAPASRSEGSTATEANSPGLLVAGIVVGGYGVVSAVISAVAIGTTGACGCAESGDYECDMTGCRIGAAHIFAGPVLLLGSIPMIVGGAWQVPSDDRGIPPTTAEVRVGPGNTSLAVTF